MSQFNLVCIITYLVTLVFIMWLTGLRIESLRVGTSLTIKESLAFGYGVVRNEKMDNWNNISYLSAGEHPDSLSFKSSYDRLGKGVHSSKCSASGFSNLVESDGNPIFQLQIVVEWLSGKLHNDKNTSDTVFLSLW